METNDTIMAERYTAKEIVAAVLTVEDAAAWGPEVERELVAVIPKFWALHHSAPEGNHERDQRTLSSLFPKTLHPSLDSALHRVLEHSRWVLPAFDPAAAGFAMHTEPFIPILDNGYWEEYQQHVEEQMRHAETGGYDD